MKGKMERRYLTIERQREKYANGQIDTKRFHLPFRITTAPSIEFLI